MWAVLPGSQMDLISIWPCEQGTLTALLSISMPPIARSPILDMLPNLLSF